MKFELTISSNYVPEWGINEALRELFQNALDQEIVNPENAMLFHYDEAHERVLIANKTSTLPVNSLLLGQTSKAEDDKTIGQHGEGYKIAFMVLLRAGKKVQVLNYGENQVWTVRMVNSRRFKALIPTVFVEKKAFWETVPDHNLTIQVDGVTKEEWENYRIMNLHLMRRDRVVAEYEVSKHGRILLDEVMKGRIYVKGLYVCTNSTLVYGYDFEPSQITLDRDRKLIQDYNLLSKTSSLWKNAYRDGFMQERVLEMINSKAPDVNYLRNVYCDNFQTVESEIGNNLLDEFIQKNPGAYPVDEYATPEILDRIKESGYVAMPVAHSINLFLTKSKIAEVLPLDNHDDAESLADRFEALFSRLLDRMTEEEVEEADKLLEELRSEMD